MAPLDFSSYRQLQTTSEPVWSDNSWTSNAEKAKTGIAGRAQKQIDTRRQISFYCLDFED